MTSHKYLFWINLDINNPSLTRHGVWKNNFQSLNFLANNVYLNLRDRFFKFFTKIKDILYIKWVQQEMPEIMFRFL